MTTARTPTHPSNAHPRHNIMERIATRATAATGSSWSFLIAVGTIVGWASIGPFVHFSDTWQLVINTGTTIVTFLMVFLIQRSQNKDAMAVHLKLNELIAALSGASNHLIDVEGRDEDDLRVLRRHYAKLVELVQKDGSVRKSHSVEEAEGRAAEKNEPSA